MEYQFAVEKPAIRVVDLNLKLVDLNFNDSFILRASSKTRGHDYKMFLNCSRLNIRKRFFSVKELLLCGTILTVALWTLPISDALRHRIVSYHIVYRIALSYRIVIIV